MTDEKITADTPTLLSSIPYAAVDPSTEPPTFERDLAMGRFIDAWSQVEWEMRNLLRILSKAPAEAAGPIAAAIPDNGRMAELLQVLGKRYLESTECDELDGIIEHVKISNNYRNSIVHGHWGLTSNREKVATRGTVYDFMWIRVYIFIDKLKELNAALGRDPAAQDRYIFSVQRLTKRAQSAHKLADRIQTFSQRIERRLGNTEPSPQNPSSSQP